jgi:hypothetical protein
MGRRNVVIASVLHQKVVHGSGVLGVLDNVGVSLPVVGGGVADVIDLYVVA